MDQVIHTSYSIVLDIICAHIYGGEEKYEQLAKSSRVLKVKPSNKRFIISLQKDIFIWLFFSRKSVELHPALCLCPSVSTRANDVNNTESH